MSVALLDVVARCSASRSRRILADEQRLAALWLERVPDFVDALYEIDDVRSSRLAAAALAETGDPQRVVTLLFHPAAHAIGESWEADEADFLQVTMATNRMQRLFRSMTHQHPPTSMPDAARRLLLAPAPGDQHAFGLAVVEDAFRRDGWEVDRCECGEVPEMFRLIGANDYRLVGISVSSEQVLPQLSSLVRSLRAKSHNPGVVLLAGGSFVTERAQDALDIGFDFTARDALSAVALARSAVRWAGGEASAAAAAE